MSVGTGSERKEGGKLGRRMPLRGVVFKGMAKLVSAVRLVLPVYHSAFA